MNYINSVSASTNGWTDHFIGESWFRDVFIPESAKQNISGKPIILLFDGHSSHLSEATISAAYANNIFLFLLPPKTTHRLQPLDVLVFAPIQRAWSKRAELRAAEGNPILRATVVAEYMDIRKDAMSAKVVVSSWKRSAHFPINRELFTDEDYAPSKNTSFVAPYPAGYPDEMPRYHLFADEYVYMILTRFLCSECLLPCGSKVATDMSVDVSPAVAENSDGANQSSAPMSALSSSPATARTRSHNLKLVTHVRTNGTSHESQNFTPAQIEYIAALEKSHREEVATKVAEAQQARMHASIMVGEINIVTQKLHAKEEKQKKKKEGPRFNPLAGHVGLLTAPEARARYEQLQAEWHAKEEQRKQVAAAKQSSALESDLRMRQRAADNGYIFPGSLKSYSTSAKEDVLALALSLRIPITDGKRKELNKATILQLVEQHFAARPELQSEPRYIGLFDPKARISRPKVVRQPVIADLAGLQRMDEDDDKGTDNINKVGPDSDDEGGDDVEVDLSFGLREGD